MLARPLVLILKAALDDVLEHELESLRELYVRSDALVR